LRVIGTGIPNPVPTLLPGLLAGFFFADNCVLTSTDEVFSGQEDKERLLQGRKGVEKRAAMVACFFAPLREKQFYLFNFLRVSALFVLS
jgi:hypothetical protein